MAQRKGVAHISATTLCALNTIVGKGRQYCRDQRLDTDIFSIGSRVIIDATYDEELLRAVVNTAVDGVILIDASAKVLMFNPACERIFGYDADEVIAHNVKMLMPARFSAAHDSYIETYLRTGERRIIGIGREVEGLRKDGTVFPMDLSVGEAKQHGRSKFVGMIHDLTEKKKTEEQLVQAQKMEAVGQLSGGVAHDFNNLLTVILGNVEMLSDALGDQPELRRLADMAIVAAERGSTLTNRLLAFSRKQPLNPSLVDAGDVIGGTENILRRTLMETIDVKIIRAAELWKTELDSSQLESTILNLVLNARDAMPRGGSLTIETANATVDETHAIDASDLEPGQYVLITVTDTGEGIPRTILQRIFEPFFTTKDVGKGSGLGLSMVYGFVKQSAGYIHVTSEPGDGTSIRLYFPRAHGMGTPATSSAPDKKASGGNENILVVEDDQPVRQNLVYQLEKLGYRVIEAASGPAALECLKRTPQIDLLFTDVVMTGGMNGGELADCARAMRPNLKILFTSGYSENVIVHQGRLDPGVELLSKPYRREQLAAVVRKVLDSG